MRAIVLGCRTTKEIEAFTDMPLKVCSAYVSQLATDGSIRKVGERFFRGMDTRRGKHGYEWEPVFATRNY